jgi:hypothetical protein
MIAPPATPSAFARRGKKTGRSQAPFATMNHSNMQAPIMNSPSLFVILSILCAASVHAQKGTLQPGETARRDPPSPPPKVWTDPDFRNPWTSPQAAPPSAAPVHVYEQKLYGGRPALVTPEQAQTIIDRFKEAYPKLGNPRFLIYVNRELVDEQSGLKLIKREETIETSRSSGATNDSTIRSTGENSYRADGKAAPTLADKQTVRDIERLFGRPVRAGGAALADQRVASQLITDKPVSELIGSSDSPQARKDREALSKVADVVVEILIASKNVSVTGLSGEHSVAVPDIQATAISLKDSRILAQASSADVTSRVPPSAMGSVSINEVAEATALELMEDLAASAR